MDITPGWNYFYSGQSRTDPILAGSTTVETYLSVQLHRFIMEPLLALQERFAAIAGTRNFPPPDFIWSSGTIISITINGDGTSTVDCGTVNWSTPPNCSTKRWSDYTCTACENFAPEDYQFVATLDLTNVWSTIKAKIINQTFTPGEDGSGPGTLIISSNPITDAIAAKYIDEDLSAYEGCGYAIQRQGATWVTDRYFDKPDGISLIKGFDSTCGTTTDWTPAGQTPTDPPTTYSFLLDNSNPLPADIFTPMGWTTDQWIDKELLIYGNGLLQRVVILGNDSTHLYFTQQDWTTAGGRYKIVEPGTIGKPDTTQIPLYQWNTGVMNQLATHGADDTLIYWNNPASEIAWDEGNPCTDDTPCESYYHNLVDGNGLGIDAYIDPTNNCEKGRAGSYVAPDFHKSIRALQTDTLGLVQSFIDPTTSPAGATTVPNLCAATAFNACGINSWTCGYSWTAAGLEVDLAPFGGVDYPATPYVALKYTNGNIVASGGILNEEGLLAGSFPNDTTTPANNPTEVILSMGYTRWTPRQVQYLQPSTQWHPDCDQEDGCIDPAATTTDDEGAFSCFGVGSWIKRPASTSYEVYGSSGIPGANGVAFVDGDLARLGGDNAGSITVIPVTASSDPDAQEAPYWDFFFRGNYNQAHSQLEDQARAGTSTGGTKTSLTDTTKNFWNLFPNGSYHQTAKAKITAVTPYTPKTATTPEVLGSATAAITPPRAPIISTWSVTNDIDGSGTGTDILDGGPYTFTSGSGSVTVPGEFTSAMVGETITFTFHGVMHVESGSATSGGTDHLIDAAHDTTTDENKCWWAGGRFSTIGTPYQTFILEITRGTGTSQLSWRVPITSSVDNGTGGIRFNFTAVDGLTVTSGDIWQVREPAYALNKWEGLALLLSDEDGGTYTATITHNDDVTLYFDTFNPTNDSSAGTETTITAGWSYQIVKYRYGSVLRYSEETSEWTPATGMDVIRNGHPTAEPFKDDPTLNDPDWVKSFGLWMTNDYVTNTLGKEIKYMINLMEEFVAGSISWTANGEQNASDGSGNVYTATSDVQNAWNLAVEQVKADWGTYTATTNSAPQMNYAAYNIQRNNDGNDVALLAQASGNYSYAVISGVPTLIPATIDVYYLPTIEPTAIVFEPYYIQNADGSYPAGGSQTWTFPGGPPVMGYGTPNVYNLLGSVSNAASTIMLPDPLGTNDIANFPLNMPSPLPPEYWGTLDGFSAFSTLSWQVVGQIAVVRPQFAYSGAYHD